MATPKSQRIGILIILVVTIIGTMGSFAVMILNTKNTQQDDQRKQQLYAQYQKDSKDYQAKLDAQAKVLSKKYYPIFNQYAARPAKFDLNSVKTLTKKDLRVGNGKTVTDSTEFAAYYIGWNPDGKVFDQSISDGSLKSPIPVSGLKTASLIEGWKKGLVGMKIGGVRELTIPSDLAYGESGQGDDIPPNTPLKFIVMAIDQPEPIPTPQVPQELLQQ
ncbi:MAG TPA: FKBP-type peptidyl-prolyl cis-trans isomerase [Patescibacteria group bacterium]|jgi:FKBP-type peptidyl-prolyl cis-trans isomerase|nr:FKBP-type peptidyl-prolyl cis-trans isomerase [Patescibacteria group bacterium]